MAIYPCDWEHHRYPGPQRSVYVTQAYGSSLVVSHALRLCEEHLGDLLIVARTHLSELEEGSAMDDNCTVCGDRREIAVFLKVFNRGEPPEELVGDFCARDGELMATELRAAHGRRLSER